MNLWESQYQETILSAQNKLNKVESISPTEWNNEKISEIYSYNKNLFKAERILDTHINLKHFKDLLLDVNIHKLWCTWLNDINLAHQPSTNINIIHAQSNSDPNSDITFVETVLKKKQCLWYLASSQNQEYFLAFKVQNNFSSTRVVVYNQWEKNIDTTHMNTLIDHLILLSSLPYVSSCDSLQIISLKYKDFNTCEIEYEYRDTIQSTTSPPVSIKSHKWHSGSWSQDKNFFSARLLSSPSLLSAPQFRPSISCPDNNQSVLQWDNVDQEDKSNKLRIKTTDYPKVYVSLPHHNDWSEKFIQLCVRCLQTKNSYIIQISHLMRLIEQLQENSTESTLRVKITLEKSKRNQFIINDTDRPLQILDYNSQSDDDDDNDDDDSSDVSNGDEKENSNEDDDIFVDGMEELEEMDSNTHNSDESLLAALPTSNRFIRPSTKTSSSSMSLPTVQQHTTIQNNTSLSAHNPKDQKPKVSASTPILIEQKEKIDNIPDESTSFERKPSAITIPESDPVALQKAYPLLTQYISPALLQPTTLVQSPCRDNGYVTIKKLDVAEHPMGAFLVESTWRNCSIWDVKAVVESIGARKIWDNTFETSTFLFALTPTSSIWHTKFKGAWPVSSRDYICFQGQYTSPCTIDLVSTSCIGESYQHKPLPKEVSGYNRATMDVAGWRLKRLDRHSVSVKNVLMTHFSTWIINYFTSRYIEQSLASVQKAKEYLDLHGAPPSLENLTNAMLVNLKHDHDRKTWRCEYSRRTESDTGDKSAKVISGASTTSYIRIDKRRWASSTKNRYSIIIDPPPSRVLAVEQAHDPYGVWLTIEHDEVFIIPFHGKILTIIKPDDTFVKDSSIDNECQVFVNGGPVAIEREEKATDILEEFSTKTEEKLATKAVTNETQRDMISEEDVVNKALDDLPVTPKKHVQAALTFLKQADEQFGWTMISDKNGIKVSKRPGTKSKKKDGESPFVSVSSKDDFLLDVPEQFMIYKASKVIEDYSSEEIIAVVSDVQSVRKAYDDTVEHIDILRHTNPGYKVIRQFIKTIFPFKSREAYTCSCLTQVPSSTSVSQTDRTIYFESSIPEFPVLPTKKPRGNLFMSAWVIEPIDPYTTATNHPIPSTRVTCVAALDLGNSIPSYISNLVVSNWFPKKIQAVQSYLKANGAPPFLSEPIPSLATESPDTLFRWENIDSSYDKNSHHYKVVSLLKALSSDTSSRKRNNNLSRKASIETVDAEKGKGELDSADAIDKVVRCGSISASLPKKRISTAENNERPVNGSRAFTFLKTTFDLRAFAKGYTIHVQLFDVTDEKKRNISDKLTMQISEPVLTIAKNDHVKHSVHIKTLQLSPSVLPATYEFEFSLRPILEDNQEYIETQLNDLRRLGEDNEEENKKTSWKSAIIVNGDRVEIGKDIKVKACTKNEEKPDENDLCTEVAQGSSEVDIKESQELQEVHNDDPSDSTRDASALPHYTSGSVVATALGNVSAGVNNIGARMMFPFRSVSNKVPIPYDHRSELSTSNSHKDKNASEVSGISIDTAPLEKSSEHSLPNLNLREARLVARPRRLRRKSLVYEYIAIGLAIILALAMLRYIMGQYFFSNANIFQGHKDQKNAHLLFRIPWFEGWDIQIIAVKTTTDA